MRVLVLNDFLADWTGSEIVALEVAEHFGATTSSFWCADPVRGALRDWRPLDTIDLTEFDFVWAQQHAVFPLLERMREGSRRPAIAWVSLSPYDVMDDVPATVLGAYADEVVCNSRETAAARGSAISFGNAAPDPFHFERPKRALRNVLFISNNQPPELLGAERLLRARGFNTRFLGRGHEFKRLEPADLDWADCAVTIGKTVRYALASALPVFVYDRFGGDGYLTDENYAAGEAHNFSGRPACRRLSGPELADAIVNGHREWDPPAQPRLGDFLDDLAARVVPSTFVRHPDLGGMAAMSSALGSWLAQAHAWRITAEEFRTGETSWRMTREVVRQKLLKSRLLRWLR